MLKTIALSLSLMATFFAFAQPLPLNKEIKNSKYSLHYNSQWKLDETGRNGTEFYLIKSPAGEFSDNIGLVIQNLEGQNLDLKAYSALSEEQIATVGTIVSSRSFDLGNHPAQELIAVIPYNELSLTFLQYYLIKEQKAYVLTFIDLTTDFDESVIDAKRVMDSFQLVHY